MQLAAAGASRSPVIAAAGEKSLLPEKHGSRVAVVVQAGPHRRGGEAAREDQQTPDRPLHRHPRPQRDPLTVDPYASNPWYPDKHIRLQNMI